MVVVVVVSSSSSSGSSSSSSSSGSSGSGSSCSSKRQKLPSTILTCLVAVDFSYLVGFSRYLVLKLDKKGLILSQNRLTLSGSNLT